MYEHFITFKYQQVGEISICSHSQLKKIKDDNCRQKKQKQKSVFDWKEFRTEYSFEFKLSAESSS